MCRNYLRLDAIKLEVVDKLGINSLLEIANVYNNSVIMNLIAAKVPQLEYLRFKKAALKTKLLKIASLESQKSGMLYSIRA